MKKRVIIFSVIAMFIGFSVTSCKKQVDFSSDIMSLKASITALQKRSDSLANALLATNTNVTGIRKSVDSIRVQLSIVLTQLTTLNSQLTDSNANITSINSQINVLNKQYAELLAKLNEILNSSDIMTLKASILALQKRSDSLANALLATNTNISSVGKSVDSIKTQLSAVLVQITSLNNQLTLGSANTTSINNQINILNKQYAELLAKLNEIIAQLAVSTTISNGLLAYYPFDGNVKDMSGNGNNGNMIGTLLFGTDRNNNIGSALNLGGGRVTTNSSMFNFQYGDSFSLSFWVLDNGSASGRLISTENSEGNFRIASYGNGIYAYNYGSGPYLYDTLKANTWTNITFVYSNRNMTLYKNGVLKTNALLTTTEQLNYGTPFTIGAKAASAFDTWNGKIDELRLYNRALNKFEAEQLSIR